MPPTAIVEALRARTNQSVLTTMLKKFMRVWPASDSVLMRQGATKRRIPLEDGALHLSLFHPLDDHYGFPPLQAALMALDIHNAAGRWNKALLDKRDDLQRQIDDFHTPRAVSGRRDSRTLAVRGLSCARHCLAPWLSQRGARGAQACPLTCVSAMATAHHHGRVQEVSERHWLPGA